MKRNAGRFTGLFRPLKPTICRVQGHAVRWRWERYRLVSRSGGDGRRHPHQVHAGPGASCHGQGHQRDLHRPDSVVAGFEGVIDAVSGVVSMGDEHRSDARDQTGLVVSVVVSIVVAGMSVT
jgi:hypothetical protein